jgi:hypothetical protein
MKISDLSRLAGSIPFAAARLDDLLSVEPSFGSRDSLLLAASRDVVHAPNFIAED